MKAAIRSFLLAIVIYSVGTLPVIAGERKYSEIIAFGDSLSDPGNGFFLAGEQTVQPFPIIPRLPYAIGGHHLSNGRTFVEQLGRKLRLQRSTGPAWKNPWVHGNYAVGASRARDGGSPYSATVQVMQFLNDRVQAPGDALYSFAFGGNDVRDALAAGGGAAGEEILGLALEAIATNLITLCRMGEARDIVVANSPNLGVTPAVKALGPAAVAGATALSVGFNLGLANTLANGVGPLCPDTNFYLLDAFALVSAVAADPSAFGFVDAEPCLTFNVIGNAICRKPNEKFFWDGIHPTKAGHAVFTKAMIDLISTP